MQPIIYDVAVSIDGYISGPSGDVSKFPLTGEFVDDYQQRLSAYASCVMGRMCYEFAYRFGLKPGENPYPSMRTVVFSTSLELPKKSDVELVSTGMVGFLKQLRHDSPGPIYLCGGGEFAGSVAKHGLIDKLRIKRVPILLGCGVKLFADQTPPGSLHHVVTKEYDDGIVFQEYDLEPSGN